MISLRAAANKEATEPRVTSGLVEIITSKVLLLFPHAYMTLADFGYPISIFKLFGFVIFARPW
jgi:hypothetical protein